MFAEINEKVIVSKRQLEGMVKENNLKNQERMKGEVFQEIEGAQLK